MDEELQRDDWDVLILHYLGLDHIGHLAGPASSLVAPKLREMNGVLAKIYRYLEKEAGKNLLIVLGDHGMTVRMALRNCEAYGSGVSPFCIRDRLNRMSTANAYFTPAADSLATWNGFIQKNQNLLPRI